MRGYSKRFTFAFYVSIKFLPFCRCTTSTCIIQFTQTSMYVKSINFIVSCFKRCRSYEFFNAVQKGAPDKLNVTNCSRVPRSCRSIGQKVQVKHDRIRFPFQFDLFFLLSSNAQQRGIGEGVRGCKKKRDERSKWELEREKRRKEKEFLFLDDSPRACI